MAATAPEQEPSAPARLRCELPAGPRSVGRLRHALVGFAREHGVAEATLGDIALAVTEACANVVQHAGTDDDFEVRVSVDGAECRIEVVDTGTGLPGPSVSPLVLDDTDPLTHGRGIGLMRILVDDLHFQPDDGGMRVVLVKHLDLVPESVLA